MTIKDAYRDMKYRLKGLNEFWGWNDNYSCFISFHSVRAKNELENLLRSDMRLSALDRKLGIIDEETYKREMKVFADCARSINKIEIW